MATNTIPPIYDLGPKFEGLSAFCGSKIEDSTIGAELFGAVMGAGPQKETVSRIKAGLRTLSPEASNKLSAYFNDHLARATGSDKATGIRGPLRAEDWSRPLTDFFADLAKHYRSGFESRLDDAHAAIVRYMNGLEAYRDRQNPLVINTDQGAAKGHGRFPTAAMPVDSIGLPTQNFNPGDRISIEIAHPLRNESIGWLFFVRNPDVRGFRPGIVNWVWNQTLADLIRWLPSPFHLTKDFEGPLPGFPCEIAPVEGEYTAYLLIEDTEAHGVRRVLEEIRQPWEADRSTFEATVHMIARAQTLFQKKTRDDSKVGYAPPRLLMRRYRVRKD